MIIFAMIIDFSDFNSFINISITVLPNKTDIKVDSFLKCMTEANINTLIIGNSINYIFKNQPKPHCPMLDIPTKQKVIQTLKQASLFPQKEIDQLPNKKNTLWRTIKKHLQRRIHYAFDQEFQNDTNHVLKELDQILNSKEAEKIKAKAKLKLELFPQILNKIIKDYKELEDEETDNLDEPQFKQKLLDSVFEKELEHWTFSELSSIVDQKMDELQKMLYHYMTQSQKKDHKACKEFISFTKDLQLDVDLLEELMTKRIGSQPNDFLDSSQLSNISSNSGVSLKSFDNSTEAEQSTVNTLLRQLSIGSASKQVSTQKQESQHLKNSNQFTKKDRFFELERKKEQEKSTQQTTQRSQEKPQINYHKNQNKKVEITFEPFNNKRLTNPQVRPFITVNQHEPTKPEQKKQENQSQQNQPQQIPPYQINESILEEENKKLYQQYSRAIIDRYSTQSRFTEEKYRQIRQNEVRNIMINQYRPLIDFLKKMPLKDIIQSSYSNEATQIVEAYGSFENKCGFRKISDLNINIEVKGINQWNISNCLFHLRNSLDSYRKKGYLKDLNLRSVIYCKQNAEVILSHNNNSSKPKIRDQNTINFIYITLNKKEHKQSSRFIKQVVYSKEPKSEDIAHLVNFLHLLFKRNKILDHKDIYHVWWTKNPQQVQEKKNSQSRYVSISTHAFHMMVLFYLIETGQISQIKYNKQKKKYDFQLIDKESSLYERFVRFLKFYSENGDYKNLYTNKNFIDIVSRTKNQQSQVLNMISSQFHKIQSSVNGYMFAFVHPLTSEFIEADNGMVNKSYVEVEIKKGTQQEKLFFKKIQEMLERSTNLALNQQWDPNCLFESMYDY